jgi:hypothetical protein
VTIRYPPVAVPGCCRNALGVERYRLTCVECGRFLTDVRIERDLLGRDVILSLNGFCAHVSAAQLERELDAVLERRSHLPVAIERIGEAGAG